MKKLLKHVFNIEESEFKVVGLNLLQSFFIGIPRLFTITAATTLFLANYSADDLPIVYIVIAFVIPVFGFIRMYFAKRVSFFSLTAGTLAALVLALVCFYILLLSTAARWVTLALLIWSIVEWVMSIVVFWNTADRLFTVRQAKRVFGLIGTGEVLALVVGGFFVSSLVRLIGTTNLLLFSIVGNILVLANLAYIRHSFKSKFTLEHEEKSSVDEMASVSIPFYKNKYILLTFAIISLNYFCYYFADNAFYDRLQIRYTEPDQLAGFLGQFFAVYGIINLFFKTLVSGRLLTRLGVRGGLCAVPLMVGACTASVVIAWMFSLSLAVIFWLVVFTKVMERVFQESIGRPAYQTLYQPLPSAESIRYQATAETVVAQIAGGLSGLILLILNKVFSFTAVGHCAVLFFIMAAWFIVAIYASREYRQALSKALKQRGLKGVNLTLNDTATVRYLEQELQSHRPMEVIYSLGLLDELEHPGMENLLLGLLEHPADSVREAVYGYLEKLGSETTFESLKTRLLEAEEPSALLGALLRALAASGEMDAFDLIANPRYLEESGPEVKLGAITGCIRYCGIEGAIAGGNRLLSMQSSTDPWKREFAARALGEIGISNFYRGLLPLLQDEHLNVREAAVKAAGILNNRKLWPLVIENLSVNEVRAAAAKALVNGGEAALEELEISYRQSSENRIRIVQIYGMIGGEKVVSLLLEKLDEPDRNLRFTVLKSLRACGYHALTQDQAEIFRNLIKDDLSYGTHVVAGLQDLYGQISSVLLSDDLNHELEKSRERIFLLLSFIYPPEIVTKVRDNFATGSQEKRAFAIELFDNTISQDLKDLIMPFLEDTSREDRLKRLSLFFPVTTVGPENRFEEIVIKVSRWRNPWLRACALDALRLVNADLTRRIASSLLSESDTLIQGTAKYVLDIQKSDSQSGRKVSATGRLSVVERVKIIKMVSLFNRVPGEILAQLACILDEINFEKGEEVVQKGSMCSSMYIIVDGKVRIHDGEQTVSTLGKRAYFGELSVLSPEPAAASVTTVEKSRILRLPHGDLRELLGDKIEFVRFIIMILCNRLKAVTVRAATGKTGQGKAPSSKGEETTAERVMEEKTRVVTGKQRTKLSSIEKIIVLKTASIFSDTPDSVLAEVENLTRETWFKAGETLFEKGDVGTTMYIIVDGKVKVHIGEKVIVELGERQIIGEMAVLTMEPRSASVTAVEDTRLLVLDQTSLYDIMWIQNEVVWGIINELIQRIRRQEQV